MLRIICSFEFKVFQNSFFQIPRLLVFSDIFISEEEVNMLLKTNQKPFAQEIMKKIVFLLLSLILLLFGCGVPTNDQVNRLEKKSQDLHNEITDLKKQ